MQPFPRRAPTDKQHRQPVLRITRPLSREKDFLIEPILMADQLIWRKPLIEKCANDKIGRAQQAIRQTKLFLLDAHLLGVIAVLMPWRHDKPKALAFSLHHF